MWKPEVPLQTQVEVSRLKSSLTTYKVVSVLLMLAVLCCLGIQMIQNQTITGQRATIRQLMRDCPVVPKGPSK